MADRASTEQRKFVKERARNLCEYCQSPEEFSAVSFSVEHIIPLADSGETTLENLAFACQGCNNHKYTKTQAVDPIGGSMVNLFHPRQQDWDKHFRWSDDFLELIGVTPTGRATVIALKLNRDNLHNLRRALYAIGEHPPKQVV